MARMNEDELLAHVEKEEANCIVHFTSMLSEQRRKAMAYYYGQPYGNEVEGRSQVVTTEVKDAVEGILPSLMAIFTSSDEIVRFEAQTEKDEEAAQQATDYINYLFSRQNNGFLALYCLFKDALLQKNGYVKVYWEDYEEQSKESYEELDDKGFQSLMDDEELELVQHTETPDEEAMEEIQKVVAQAEQTMAQLQPQQQMMLRMQLEQMMAQKPMLHDAVFKRTKRHKGICIDPLPPEEVLVSRETPNELTKARFVEHRTLRTLSEIREMGFDVPDDIADYAPNADFNLERVERLKFDDALAYRQDSDTSDPSTKQVWLCEAYCRVDYDGDGIAELRKVTKVGKTLLDNEEFDSLPVIGGTAVLMPHKHYGLSLFDLVGDIQLIKSTITRQLLDNAYGANNSRMAVLDGMVNMGDLLTSRPNGIVRMKSMGAVQQLPNQLLGQPFYNLLDYFDKVKQQRTGSTGFPNAVDPDAINSKAAFVDKFAEASMERINLMARILAETCVKDIFWKILELVSKHQNKPQVVKLRGKWVEVDPREWRDRFHMTVSVGLGTGSQQKVLNSIQTMGNLFLGAMQSGHGRVIQESNVYHLLKMAARATFPKDADALVTDPSTLPPVQPPPNVDLMKVQLAAHKVEVQDQQKKDKMQFDAGMTQLQQQFDSAMAQFEARTAQAEQERQHTSQMEQKVLDHHASFQQKMAEAVQASKDALTEHLANFGLVDKESEAKQQQQALQAQLDSLLQAQKAMDERIQAAHEAALAPRETEVTERDPKGKVKKAVSRVKQ